MSEIPAPVAIPAPIDPSVVTPVASKAAPARPKTVAPRAPKAASAAPGAGPSEAAGTDWALVAAGAALAAVVVYVIYRRAHRKGWAQSATIAMNVAEDWERRHA